MLRASTEVANNPANRKLARHIDTRRYCVWDLVKDGVMTLVTCTGTGSENAADVLTKSRPGPAWSLCIAASDGHEAGVQGVFRST